MTDTRRSQSSWTSSLRIRSWFADTLLDDFLRQPDGTVPASNPEWRAFADWMARKFDLKEPAKGSRKPSPRLIEPATLRSWSAGTRMPTADLDVFAVHYGSGMDVLDPTEINTGFSLLLNALDVLDVSDAEALAERVPAAANILTDGPVRARFVSAVKAFQPRRVGAARAASDRLCMRTATHRDIDVFSEAEPWFKAAHQYVLAERSWVPEASWGTNVLDGVLGSSATSELARTTLMVQLAEFGCRVVSKDIEVPSGLAMEFASATVCEIGLRLNLERQAELGFALDAAGRLVDLAANVLFFSEGVDQIMIETEVCRSFGSACPDDTAQWLAQFLLRTRDRIEYELESRGMLHSQLQSLVSRAMAVSRFCENPDLWIPSNPRSERGSDGDLEDEENCG